MGTPELSERSCVPDGMAQGQVVTLFPGNLGFLWLRSDSSPDCACFILNLAFAGAVKPIALQWVHCLPTREFILSWALAGKLGPWKLSRKRKI